MADNLRRRKALSGPRAILTFNDQELGYCTGVAVEEAVMYEPIIALGRMKVLEHVPVGYEVVSFTAERFLCTGDNLRGGDGTMIPLMAKHGNSDQDMLEELLLMDDIKACIPDSVSGTNVLLLEQVRLATRGLSFSPRRLVLENLSFVAISAKDDSEANGV